MKPICGKVQTLRTLLCQISCKLIPGFHSLTHSGKMLLETFKKNQFPKIQTTTDPISMYASKSNGSNIAPRNDRGSVAIPNIAPGRIFSIP
jgi:hypothetical protein